jgi:hypothetical protein
MSRDAQANRWVVIGWSLSAAIVFSLVASFGQGQTSAHATSKRSPTVPASAPKKGGASSSAVHKAAPSASTAAGGLVHKSAAYWGGYRSDIIQQVFDGAFRGADMDRNTQFHILFSGYVEQYSDNCSDYLRGHFDHRVITHTVNGVASTSAINIDYRYLPKYDEYSQNAGLDTLRVLTGSVSFGDVAAPALDMITFFSTERCDSAAVRQLGENLLRGANGQPSLQASGGSIAGAAAESQIDGVPSPAVASRLGALPKDLSIRAAGSRSLLQVP